MRDRGTAEALLSKSVTATLPAALLVVFWWRRGAAPAIAGMVGFIRSDCEGSLSSFHAGEQKCFAA